MLLMRCMTLLSRVVSMMLVMEMCMQLVRHYQLVIGEMSMEVRMTFTKPVLDNMGTFSQDIGGLSTSSNNIYQTSGVGLHYHASHGQSRAIRIVTGP